MNLTAEDIAKINRRYEQTISNVKRILDNPELVQLIPEEKPHIWKRLKELAAMPDDILKQEEEADYVLFGWLIEFMLEFASKSEWDSPDKRYEWFRDWLKDIYERPEDVFLVPGKDPHIWKRLEVLNNMSCEEFMDELELGTILDRLN